MAKTAKITSKGQIKKHSVNDLSVTSVCAKSPFARYRGIGNEGTGRGRRAIVNKLRKLRGD